MATDIRLAVVGSRGFNNARQLYKVMDKIIAENDYNVIEIVSGGAKGPDSFGESYARIHNIPTKIFLPDWKKYGRSAGFRRNVDIIENCDVCIACWDGSSHGTKHDIRMCYEQNKPCYIYNYIDNIVYLNEESV